MPYSYDLDELFIIVESIHNLAGLANHFTNKRLVELRHDTTGFRKISQPFPV